MDDLGLPKTVMTFVCCWQLLISEYCFSLAGSLLADDMGLGKTLQSAVLLQYLRDQGKVNSDFVLFEWTRWNRRIGNSTVEYGTALSIMRVCGLYFNTCPNAAITMQYSFDTSQYEFQWIERAVLESTPNITQLITEKALHYKNAAVQ